MGSEWGQNGIGMRLEYGWNMVGMRLEYAQNMVGNDLKIHLFFQLGFRSE